MLNRNFDVFCGSQFVKQSETLKNNCNRFLHVITIGIGLTIPAELNLSRVLNSRMIAVDQPGKNAHQQRLPDATATKHQRQLARRKTGIRMIQQWLAASRKRKVGNPNFSATQFCGNSDRPVLARFGSINMTGFDIFSGGFVLRCFSRHFAPSLVGVKGLWLLPPNPMG